MQTLKVYAMSKLVVLVVEDEALIRLVAVDFIEEAGFEAVEAAHAEKPSKFLSHATTLPPS